MELLQQADAQAGGTEGLVATMNDAEVAKELEALAPDPRWPLLVPQLLKPRINVTRQCPAAAKALCAEVDRLVAERMEPMVERRPQERAEAMYRTSTFAAVQADDSAPGNGAAGCTQEARDVREAPRTRVPRGLMQRDLDRPWGRGGAPNIRRPRG